MKPNWHARLKTRRIELGLKKVEIARRVGVSAPTVTDWESGNIRNIDGENLVNLANVLKVTAEWLMFGTRNLDGQASTLAAEFAWVYEHANEEGRAFLRNTVKVVSETFVPAQDTKNRLSLQKKVK